MRVTFVTLIVSQQGGSMNIAAAAPHLDRLLQVLVLDRCERLARRSELLFVVSFAVISLFLSVAADLVLSLLGFADPDRPALLAHGTVFLVLGGVVFAPLAETLMLQQLPISLSSRFGMSRFVQFLMGCVPFAAVHFDAGLISGFAGGVAGGIVLSLAYLTFFPRSKAKAFVVTAAIHSLHNLLPIAVIARDIS